MKTKSSSLKCDINCDHKIVSKKSTEESKKIKDHKIMLQFAQRQLNQNMIPNDSLLNSRILCEINQKIAKECVQSKYRTDYTKGCEKVKQYCKKSRMCEDF